MNIAAEISFYFALKGISVLIITVMMTKDMIFLNVEEYPMGFRQQATMNDISPLKTPPPIKSMST